MSQSTGATVGAITWVDLTVANAVEVRDFYRAVAGWETSDVDMGGYNDFNMNQPADGKTVAGICHSRGPNADLPPQWLIYITVADIEQSAAQCRKLGGEVVAGPKGMGKLGRYCVVRDPAGAVAALFQPASAAGKGAP